MSGFIQLHRSILDWEWYSEPNTCRLFLHCLLKANWKEKSHRGKTIKRGHFLTSLELLAQETGLSVRNVRTAIKNLKATHELTVISTRQGTEIIVNNYDLYQDVTNKATHELTDKRQTSDKQVTSTNKGNKGNKENNCLSDDKSPETKTTKKSKKTRFNENLELPKEWADLAKKYWLSKNRPDIEPEDTFIGFKSYHLANGTTSANWQQSWVTWYTRAIQFNKPNTPPTPPTQTTRFQSMPVAGSEQ